MTRIISWNVKAQGMDGIVPATKTTRLQGPVITLKSVAVSSIEKPIPFTWWKAAVIGLLFQIEKPAKRKWLNEVTSDIFSN